MKIMHQINIQTIEIIQFVINICSLLFGFQFACSQSSTCRSQISGVASWLISVLLSQEILFFILLLQNRVFQH